MIIKPYFSVNRTKITQRIGKNAIFIVCLIATNTTLLAQAIPRPCILVTPTDRQNILKKIETRDWAKTIYTGFMNQLDKDIELHQANPEDFLKEMPFEWEKSKPGETPPLHTPYML